MFFQHSFHCAQKIARMKSFHIELHEYATEFIYNIIEFYKQYKQ